MRKVVLYMRTTLDGYACGPKGELDWMFRQPTGPDQEGALMQFQREVGTTLLGREAYLQQAAYWPSQTGELADIVNGKPKIVFSTTLKQAEWNNTRLATDAGEEIARLKQEPGDSPIYVSGGATLAQSLSRVGLIDEYRIVVYPLALGAGKPLFKDLASELPLRLVSATPFASGAVELIYERADRA
jgi:dihydrofolate reductase